MEAGRLKVAPELADPRRPRCPRCGQEMERQGPGWWVCPDGHGEWLDADEQNDTEPPAQDGRYPRMPWEAKQYRTWLGLPLLGCHIPRHPSEEVPRGHSGRGRSSSGGRGASPHRQKYEAWLRRTLPGRHARSVVVSCKQTKRVV